MTTSSCTSCRHIPRIEALLPIVKSYGVVAGVAERHLIYGYDAEDWPLEPAIEAFERLAAINFELRNVTTPTKPAACVACSRGNYRVSCGRILCYVEIELQRRCAVFPNEQPTIAVWPTLTLCA